MIDGSEKRNRQFAFKLQNSHVCEKRSNRQNTRFASIFLAYVLSDHSIILKMCTAGWRGCKITCKGGLFFYPTLKRVTLSTWGPLLPC